MRGLRFGVLGCSAFALRRMLPAVAATPDCAVTVVASRRPDAAWQAAATFGCRAADSYFDVLAADDVDAVYVPVPAALHARWAEAALRAGKHVLVEKPLSLDPDTTRRLLNLAAERGLALTENLLFVHHGQHEAVRRLVAAGAIGRVRAVDAAFAVPRRAPGDIRLRPDLGGGALWDTGVYPLRVASYLLGPGLTVEAAVRSVENGVDVAGTVLLSRPDGIAVTARYGLHHQYRNDYSIWGSDGLITVQHAFTPAGDRRPDVTIDRGTATESVPLPAEDQAVAAIAAFARAAAAGAPPDPDHLLEQARLREAVHTFATKEGDHP